MRKFVRKYVKKNVPKSSVIPVRRGLQHSEGISLFLTCPSLPVILESDTSQYGIGAVILHRFPNGDERPIAYASRSLNSSEKNYSQIEKEGLAISFSVTKYYMYLFGRKFKLRTDHKALLKILAPGSPTPVLAAARLQRWSLLLSSYQYEIEFKPSAEVASSDALSRLPLQYRKDASVEGKIF